MPKIITSLIIIFCLVVAAGIYFEVKQSRLPGKSTTQTPTTTQIVPTSTSPIAPPTSTTSSVPVISTGTIGMPNLPGNTNTSSASSSVPVPVVSSSVHLKWGAYVGDAEKSLSDFESLVGKRVNILADFEGWDNDFPSQLKSKVGQAGKTLLIFWEPSFGFDSIIDGSHDDYITKFADEAKVYNYPVILVPFDEMNLNEEAWGYGQNNNTADKFKTAWIHIHDLFAAAGAKNVKFGLAYNNVSIPDIPGNKYTDYYPGAAYVDYVGVDGFNFGNPPLTFSQIFDDPIRELQVFHKPIYIFSMGDVAGPGKDNWIKDGLGYEVRTYPNLVGWIWFNQGGSPNWLVNSDANSLDAFKSVIPKN